VCVFPAQKIHPRPGVWRYLCARSLAEMCVRRIASISISEIDASHRRGDRPRRLRLNHNMNSNDQLPND